MAFKTSSSADLLKALKSIQKNGVDLVSVIQESQGLYRLAKDGYYIEKVTSQGIMAVRECNLAVAATVLKFQADHIKWLYDRIEGYSEEDEMGQNFKVTVSQAIPLVRSIK
jgi:hypothetical protein